MLVALPHFCESLHICFCDVMGLEHSAVVTPKPEKRVRASPRRPNTFPLYLIAYSSETKSSRNTKLQIKCWGAIQAISSHDD